MSAKSYTDFRVASWGSSGDLTHQLVVAGGAPMLPAAVDLPADAPRFFPLTSTGPHSAIAGLASWTAQLAMQLKTPSLGAGIGALTFSNGTVFNLDQFTVDIAIESMEVTDSGVDDGWKIHIPGGYTWRGTFGGFLDGSSVLKNPGAAHGSLPSAMTIKYGPESAHTLAGSVTAGYAIQVAAGVANRYTGSFEGSGALTGGSIASGVILSGALAIPTPRALVLSGLGGTRVSGTAFPTSIGISWTPADFVSVNVTAQGSGDPNLTS